MMRIRGGDHKRALELQKALCNVPPQEFSHRPGVSFHKESLRQIGFNVGLPRKPRTLLNEQEKTQVAAVLKTHGLDMLKAGWSPKLRK